MDIVVLQQQAINAISLGAIYALFALGYSLVFSILGVLNLAHSAIFMWGAFIGLLALDSAQAPRLLSAYGGVVVAHLIFYGLDRALMNRVRASLVGRPPILTTLVSLGQGIVAFAGGALTLVILLGYLEPTGVSIAPLVGFALAMIGAGYLSVALEFVAFRPLRRRNAARMAQLISSIGAAYLLVNGAQWLFERLFNRTEAYYPRDITFLPFIPTGVIIVGDLRITPIRLVIVIVALVIMVGLQYLVVRTRTGQQMRAVSFNQRTASLLGINVSRIFVLTFFLAGALGGAAGMLFGVAFLNVTPFIGESVALIGLTAIVLGGMGSIQGAVIGGFIIAFLQTGSTMLGGSSYRDAVVFILLFLVLLVRPQGLLGQPEQTRA